MHRRVPVFVAVAALGALAPAALAADRTVGPDGDYATIQAAAEAADAGDRIVIAPGLYLENVSVTGKPGLTFQGGAGVVWDGTLQYFGPGVCLAVTGADVTVRDIAFRNGAVQVLVKGDRARIVSCTSVAANRDAFRILGGSAVVEDCTVRSALENAVDIAGPDGRVEDSRFSQSGLSAVSVAGERFTAQRNEIDVTHEGPGIAVVGASARCEGNTIRACQTGAIDVTGDRASVLGNTIESVAFGPAVLVTGSRAVVSRNDVGFIDGAGIHVEGDRMTVEGNDVVECLGTAYELIEASPSGGGVVRSNTATDCRAIAFFLRSPRLTMTGCTVTRCGSNGEEAIRAVGRSVTISSCTVTESSGGGISVSGERSSVLKCRVEDCAGDGIVVGGLKSRVVGCTVKSCDGDGLRNTGTSVTAAGCTLSDNHMDLARDPAATWAGATVVASKNRFTTGGPDALHEEP